MKPVFAKIMEGAEVATYATKVICRPSFSTEFHFHNACQMTYIVQSEGKRIIGDSVGSFASDELTFVGPGLPHVWHNAISNQPDVSSHSTKESRSLALYIEPKQMTSVLGHFFPTHKFESFLTLSKRGLLFKGRAKERLKKRLEQIVKLEYGFEKTRLLLEIIELMINTDEFDYLSSAGYTHNYNPGDTSKIDYIFKFVFDNYTRGIQLDQVAEISNMSKHSFCRYFKSRTQKTFVQFVNEVRISESCRLIAENNQQITNIAYACGFNSLSNFNKIFKSIKGVTPSKYKMLLRQ